MQSAATTRRVHVGFIYMMVLLATIWEVGNTSMVRGTDMDVYASADVPAMFVFGDSLLDPGNGVYLQATSKSRSPIAFFESGHLPYGRDFPSHRPSGRYSNGLTLADILAMSLGLPYPSPYLVKRDDILKGTNFAVAGAVIDNHMAGSYPFPTLNLYDQVGLFAEVRKRFVSTLGESSTSTLISKSLFLTWMGANDFYTNYNSNPLGKSTAQKKYNPYEFNKLVISTYRNHLEMLYGLGARKFAIVSLPPLGCVPVARFLFYRKNETCIPFFNEEAQDFNIDLLSMSEELQAGYPDGHFTFLNAYNIAFDLVTDPTSYGFVEGIKPCCATGPLGGVPVCAPTISSICEDASKYVFWDFGHPTEATDKFAAKRFMTGSPPDVQPYNLQELSKL